MVKVIIIIDNINPLLVIPDWNFTIAEAAAIPSLEINWIAIMALIIGYIAGVVAIVFRIIIIGVLAG